MMLNRTTRLIVGLLAALTLAAIAASPASALVTRPNTFYFGPDGTTPPGTGPFFGENYGGPEGIAFHPPDRLYVLNAAGNNPPVPNGIYAFDPSAAFAPVPAFTPPVETVSLGYRSGIAVDTSGGASDGNVYFVSGDTNLLYAFSSSGTALFTVDPRITPGVPQGKTSEGEIGISGVAVDPSGNVWVSNRSTGYLLKYSSAGAYLGAVNVGSMSTGQPLKLDFDSASNVYVSFENGFSGGEFKNGQILKIDAPAYTTTTVIHDGSYPQPTNLAINRSNGHILLVWGDQLEELDATGALVQRFGTNVRYSIGTETFNTTSYTGGAFNPATDEIYVGDRQGGQYYEKVVRVFGPVGIVPDVTTAGPISTTRTTATVKGHVNLAGGGNVTSCKVQAGTEPPNTTGGAGRYDGGTFPCNDAMPITSDQDVTATLTGLKAQELYYYRIVASNANGPDTGAHFEVTTDDAVKDVQTLDATNVGLDSATLHGSFDRDGFATNYYFQYTTECCNFFTGEPFYNSINVTAAPPGPLAPSDTVEFNFPNGLQHGKTYYYRLVGTNEFGTTFGNDKTFYTSAQPTLDDNIFVSDVKTDQALIHLTGNPNGLLTTYHIEYGTEGDCASNPCASVPANALVLGAGVEDGPNTFELKGLQPDTTYYYRVVMSNSKGTVTNVTSHHFKTFANLVLPPACPNDLVRQQTGAALLLDCRAFELVSAANTGGYDVESTLAPGQEPYAGYPHASNPSQVLYGIHDGAIPGLPGNPTNKGIDPYVATRGNDGWTTKYVGIPANETPSAAPFSSTLLEADDGLDTFAFGGDDLCSPCFPGGATGIPMRMPDGSLIQGMAGKEDPGAAAARDGQVAKAFSADGSHFVFGSTLPYEPDGNDTGDVSIYDRNLKTGVTQVVSKTPAGTNLPCLEGAGSCHSPDNTSGISELDISADGSRIVVGQLVDEDSAGNEYSHLYMHIGTDSHTVDLTPGTTTGAHFAGMSSDGSEVYFTTRDPLTTASDQDEDTSLDLFRASVDGSGAMTLTRVSTGVGVGNGSGNFDECDPSGNSKSPDDWNTPPGGPTDCSVVAVGGGGGVAAGDGTVYFLSPETLGGDGQIGAPNLFVVRPGSSPEFVTTLASNANHPFAPNRHLLDYELTGFSIPAAAAIDHATGSYYVMDNTFVYPFQDPTAFVQKFDSSGNLDQSFGSFGKLTGDDAPTGGFRQLGQISGNAAWALPDSIAVDNTCTDLELTGNACTSFDPSNGMLYVPDRGNNVVDKFDSDGNYISQIDVTEIVGNLNTAVNGVDVDPSTGKVFVMVSGGNQGSGIMIYDNALDNAYTGKSFGGGLEMAIDMDGNVYVTSAGFSPSTEVSKYSPPYSNSFTSFFINKVSGIAYDVTTDHLYLDRGDRVEEYTTDLVQVGPTFGTETLEQSYGLDAYDGRVVVSNKGPQTNDGRFSIFTEPRIPPDQRHDDSLVIDSVNDGNRRHTEDFQITPDGDIAAFGSALNLTGYEPSGHTEVYRYDQPEEELLCVSCPSTNAVASGDSSLAAKGLNLTDDGRMFFTATEPLVLRDTNGKEDVYEWNDGDVQPISPGQDQFGSRLLTVSADGKDVYFFTHATLVSQDRSGGQAKIYDARENGGFFVVPAQPPCVASDECHGPGTQAAPSPDIGSYGGAPTGVATPSTCPKGKVRRKGRCVKPPHKKRRHRKRQATRKHG
jgi:hypothetical protein